jgi:branched-chain amino acid transport system substrate-binding protein
LSEEKSSTVGRRNFVKYAIVAIVVGVIAGVGGYVTGSAAVPPTRIVTETVTKTVTAPPITKTVTSVRTETVTAPPVTKTVTKTVTMKPTPPRKEIVLGCVTGLTGAVAYFGHENKWAIERAIKEINGTGGIYLPEYGVKLPVKLIIHDDKSDPTLRASLTEKLITVDKVDALIGSVGTTFMLAAAPIIEKYKVPIVTSGVASVKIHEMGYKYIFTNFFLSYDQFLIFFKWWETLPAEERPKTVAIWEEATEHGHENAEYMAGYCKEYGYEIVLREKYLPGADFTSLIMKTKALKPDVVMSLPTGADAINMIRQSKELDFSPNKCWALTYGTAMGGFGKELGKDANYVFAVVPYHKSLPFSVNAQIVREYITETGMEPVLLGNWYAQVQILADAIERAGKLDHEAIRDALLETDLMTTMGRVRFEPDGRLKDSWENTYILQWQNGKLELVYPYDLATSKVWYPTPTWGART